MVTLATHFGSGCHLPLHFSKTSGLIMATGRCVFMTLYSCFRDYFSSYQFLRKVILVVFFCFLQIEDVTIHVCQMKLTTTFPGVVHALGEVHRVGKERWQVLQHSFLFLGAGPPHEGSNFQEGTPLLQI